MNSPSRMVEQRLLLRALLVTLISRNLTLELMSKKTTNQDLMYRAIATREFAQRVLQAIERLDERDRCLATDVV